MSTIQVADLSFVVAPAQVVAGALADRAQWRRWFTSLDLTVTDDRGVNGIRWSASGALRGTSEVWLQPHLDGVLLHYFVHGEPVGDTNPVELTSRLRRDGRRMALQLKRRVEGGRGPGERPTHV